MRKVEIVLNVVLIGGLMIWAALNYLNYTIINFFIIGVLGLNFVLNARKHITRTYYLVFAILIIEWAFILFYSGFKAFPVNIYWNWLIYAVLFIFLIFIAHNDYKNRKNNSKRPWKNEW